MKQGNKSPAGPYCGRRGQMQARPGGNLYPDEDLWDLEIVELTSVRSPATLAASVALSSLSRGKKERRVNGTGPAKAVSATSPDTSQVPIAMCPLCQASFRADLLAEHLRRGHLATLVNTSGSVHSHAAGASLPASPTAQELPCPLCGASLRADRLPGHPRVTHDASPSVVNAEGPSPEVPAPQMKWRRTRSPKRTRSSKEDVSTIWKIPSQTNLRRPWQGGRVSPR